LQKARFDPLGTNFNFEVLCILLFGVVGALVATNEYGSGLIRTTLVATPQRGLVLAAKAVLAGLVLVRAGGGDRFHGVLCRSGHTLRCSGAARFAR